MKLAALFTGGKDSTYAIYLAQQAGHEIVCLITLHSQNPDSYMFHTPAIELTQLQAQAMDLPLLTETTKGEKEAELTDLKQAIIDAQKQYEFAGVITGALFSEYQASRIAKINQELNLQTINPLWHKPQEQLMTELLHHKFQFIFTAVAAEGLDKTWLNKTITFKDLQKLQQIPGINLAGEGGEFESLVTNCPLFQKQLIIEQAEIIEENKNTARLIIKKARLQ